MASGDITITDRADGWSSDLRIADWAAKAGTVTYDASKLSRVTTSWGYTAASLVTKARTIACSGTVRKPTPDEADIDETVDGSDLVVRIRWKSYTYALDQAVGAGTTGTDPTFTAAAGFATAADTSTSNAATAQAITPGSTLDYFYPVVQWDEVGGVCNAEKLTAAFKMAVVAGHIHGIDSVRFDATGQTSSANLNETVSTPEGVARSATGLYVPVFRTAALALTGFTQGETIRGRFRVYPLVGNATYVVDSEDVTAADDEPLLRGRAEYVCDKTGGLVVYAYVDLVAGNNATGVASATRATAVASPFQHVGKAVQAGATIIEVKEGQTHPAVGTAPASRVASTHWIEVRPSPGHDSSDTTVQVTATTEYRCSRLMFSGVKVSLLNTSSYMYGEDADNFLRFYNCVGDTAGVAEPSVPIGYATNLVRVYNCPGEWGRTAWNMTGFSTARCAYAFNGTVIGGGQMTAVYQMLGCSISGDFTLRDKPGEATPGNVAPEQDGCILAYNRGRNLSSNVDVVWLGHNDKLAGISRGFMCEGNDFEKTTNAGALFVLWADSSYNYDAKHVLFRFNTCAGGRCQLGYNDHSTDAPLRVGFSAWANVTEGGFSCKTDTFVTADPARVNNWSLVNGVECDYNVVEDVAALSSFQPDYFGDGSELVAVDGIDFIDNASLTGDGTGSGDYHGDTGAVFLSIVTDRRGVVCDLDGRELSVSAAAAGALQPLVPGVIVLTIDGDAVAEDATVELSAGSHTIRVTATDNDVTVSGVTLGGGVGGTLTGLIDTIVQDDYREATLSITGDGTLRISSDAGDGQYDITVELLASTAGARYYRMLLEDIP